MKNWLRGAILTFILTLGPGGLPISGPACWAQSVGARNQFKIGRSSFEKGDYKKAIEYFDRAIKEEQNFSDAHFLAGLSYLGLKEYEKAREKLEYTIQLEPRFLPSYQYLGQVYLAQKKYDKAREVFTALQRVAGGNATSVYCLGVLAYAQKDLKEAERQFREATRLDPKMAKAHNNLGVLCLLEKRYNEAQGYFRTASSIANDQMSYVANAALIHVERGDKNQARPLLDRIRRHSGKRQDLVALAQAMDDFLNSRWEACIKSCDQALAQNEELTWALLLKLRSQKQLKAPDADLKKTAELLLESDPNVKEAQEELARLQSTPASTPTPADTPTQGAPTPSSSPTPKPTPSKQSPTTHASPAPKNR